MKSKLTDELAVVARTLVATPPMAGRLLLEIRIIETVSKSVIARRDFRVREKRCKMLGRTT